jgi:UDPglucose 6-dehydrogenase|tara:strand:- start:820 stop:1617 length:798 start_codon:yes stop_codon:yes gene_type:complete
MKLGIIGKGFVGSAVANGFDRDVEQFIVDPNLNNNTIKDLVTFDPPLTFVCVPTPEQDSHMDVDVSVVRDVLSNLNNESYKGIIVIKSTITPDHLTTFKKTYSKLKMVYNPEFLTEANSFDDFKNPSMQVLGGKWRDCEVVEKAYVKHSSVKIVPTFKTDLITASLIKYSINCWLATKVTFFNELFHVHKNSGTKVPWSNFVEMLSQDDRIGDSHMKVPGPDGKYGYGGHCFPKDTKALLYYSKLKKAEMKLLKKAIELNSYIRD